MIHDESDYRFDSGTITNMDGDVKARRPYEGAARQARTRRTRAAVVEAARTPVRRARLRRDDHRGDQRPLGYPAGDGVPAVLLEARDPQGRARRLDRR